MMIRIVLVTAILIMGGCASPQKSDYKRFKKNEQVTSTAPLNKPINIMFVPAGVLDVRGVYNPDDNIGAGGMLYAGDAGAGGMLAQVLVHAAISSGAQDKKLAEQQKQANKVLEPIQDLIANMDTKILEHESAQYRFVATTPEDDVLVVHSQPIFFISQDFTTFSVRNLVEVSELSTKSKKQRTKKSMKYENLIEVIGAPANADSALDLYRKGDGEELNIILSELYRSSLDLLVQDLQNQHTSDSPQSSFKFTHGEHQRFERGNVVKSDCDRTVIRNLRGWLISFKPSDDPQRPCSATKAAAQISAQ